MALRRRTMRDWWMLVLGRIVRVLVWIMCHCWGMIPMICVYLVSKKEVKWRIYKRVYT